MTEPVQEMSPEAPALVEDPSSLGLSDNVRELILSDTPEGFEMFFMALYNREFQEIWREWIQALYDGYEQDKGVLIESFRFSWKTTVLTNAFLAYRIGLEPSNSNMIIQVKDETAEQTAAAVAKIIEQSAVWKWIFPEVVPDPSETGGRGWGHKGYYVKRTDMDYSDWIRSCGRDPSLVGYGYTSDSIIGKHPSGMLVIDDIHNETNTSSARELQRVMDILTGTILPTIDPAHSWVLFVGTPWVANDALGYVKDTGRFLTVKTTITVNGEPEGEPVWPEAFDRERIQELRDLVGELEFRRMYLCNIDVAEGMEFKKEWLHYYPAERINPTWPIVFGVDYASLSDVTSTAQLDYFALAVGMVLPAGSGLVIIDGVYAKLTQAEAEQRIMAMAKLYPTLQAIGFETLGGGKEMFNIMLRTTNLPLVPLQKGNRNKRSIYHKVLVPAFQSTRVRLLDEPNQFVKAFENEWLSYPAGQHDDALDAVYYCGRAAAEYLVGFSQPDSEQDFGDPTAVREPKVSPWASFGMNKRARDNQWAPH